MDTIKKYRNIPIFYLKLSSLVNVLNTATYLSIAMIKNVQTDTTRKIVFNIIILQINLFITSKNL